MRQQQLVARRLALMVIALLPLGSARGGQECLPELVAAESRHHVPAGLLVSMALVESGKIDPVTGLTIPWPWTIQADGQGRFFDTPDEAVREARKTLTGGDALIDIGCLQVDLYHHPNAFPSLAAAFDPQRNVDYAAGYLADLARLHGSWLEAVAAYNAGRPGDGIDYLARVLYLWRGVKLTADAAQPVTESGRKGFRIADLPAPFEIAARFYALKDYPAAMAIYADALRTRPDDGTALTGAGLVLLAQGKPDEARDRFEHALISSGGDNKAAIFGLLRAIDSLPPGRAMTALLSARAVAPAAPELPTRLAFLQAAAGNLPDAAASMGEAARLAPGDMTRRLDYALMLDRAGAQREALAVYSSFLAQYRPGESPALGVPLDTIRQRVAFLQSHAS